MRLSARALKRWSCEWPTRVWLSRRAGPKRRGTHRRCAGRVGRFVGLRGGRGWGQPGPDGGRPLPYGRGTDWGPGWGQRGRAWITKHDLSYLLSNQGDCVTATEIEKRN